MASRRKALNKLMRPTSTPVTDPSPDHLIELIEKDLPVISEEAKELQQYYTDLNTQLGSHLERLKNVYADIKTLGEDEKGEQLKLFRTKLLKLKLMSPSKYRLEGALKDEDLRIFNQVKQIIKGAEASQKPPPQLHKSDVFKTSREFQDFAARFAELNNFVKLCLLCFSIFPAGAVIKKRLMLQWWIVEGYASSEEDARDRFEELMGRGFIEPVEGNRGLSRLHPFHRSALVALAERARLFNFGSRGDASLDFSVCLQACMNQQGEGEAKKGAKKEKGPELEKLHLLMNVNLHTLEPVEEWFPKMRNLNFLYLGRWTASPSQNIQVDRYSKFLNELRKMKYLKLLSFRGLLNIISLPDSILKLAYLEVLDLRACSDLESLPEKIQKLERLTHLDISDCFLLDHMPKGLSHLTNLKVLKGFFIGYGANSKSCTICDLKKLKHLEKLCICTGSGRHGYPQDPHIADLEGLESLTKLTITWRGDNRSDWMSESSIRKKAEAEAESESEAKLNKRFARMSESWIPRKVQAKAKLPPKLTKLDLKCFPILRDTPSWLKPKNLEGIKLNKLYITGGRLDDLGQYQGYDGDCLDEKKWPTVEVLRLKHLSKMEMDWRQLQSLFPRLKYLEKVSCPRLTLFPCNAKGIWINPEN